MAVSPGLYLMLCESSWLLPSDRYRADFAIVEGEMARYLFEADRPHYDEDDPLHRAPGMDEILDHFSVLGVRVFVDDDLIDDEVVTP